MVAWIAGFFGVGRKNLIQETNEEGYVMIGVRPDGYYRLCSDIQHCPKLPLNLCQGIWVIENEEYIQRIFEL